MWYFVSSGGGVVGHWGREGVGVKVLGVSGEAGWMLDRTVGDSDSMSMLSSSGVRGMKQLVVFPLPHMHCCVAIRFVRFRSVIGLVHRTGHIKVFWACRD